MPTLSSNNYKNTKLMYKHITSTLTLSNNITCTLKKVNRPYFVKLYVYLLASLNNYLMGFNQRKDRPKYI